MPAEKIHSGRSGAQNVSEFHGQQHALENTGDMPSALALPLPKLVTDTQGQSSKMPSSREWLHRQVRELKGRRGSSTFSSVVESKVSKLPLELKNA